MGSSERLTAVRLSACLFALALAGSALLAFGTAPAAAEIPPRLVAFGEVGTGAGELNPGPNVVGGGGEGGGIDVDPVTGHIFVSEFGNHRVSEFTAWGEFVKAWGWGVEDGSPELQTCTTTCQEGLSGTAPGQFDQPNGIALDGAGNVYVFERLNARVQVFSPAGDFLRMFGGGVNQTTGEDVCTKVQVGAGDVCGAGSSGTSPGEFSIQILGNKSTAGDYIDIDSSGTIYVGDRDRIQLFELSGVFAGEISFAKVNEASPSFPATGHPGSLSVDPETGDIYFAFSHSLGPASAFRLTSAGTVSYQLPTVAPEALAAAADEVLYVADDPEPTFEADPEERTRVLEVVPPGTVTDECCISPKGSTIRGMATSVVTAGGQEDLYLLHTGADGPVVEIRGPGPDKWLPPVEPPTIESQFAVSVADESAVVRAQINPNFWQDTTYYVEYGTSDCSLGGCQKLPTPPGSALGGGIVKAPITTEAIELPGLAPATTYHYRFVAQSGGGGPVFGADRTFTTFSAASPPDVSCPNQAFRSGTPSAPLEDCRAYEMVSPVDKLGGDILGLCNSLCLRAELNQAAPTGTKVTYSSYRSFGNAQSGGYITQYLASRGAGGWSTNSISPPREGSSRTGSSGLDSDFRAFSEDLSKGWLVKDTDPLLAPGAVSGFANLYRRDNLTGTYEAITNTAPPNQTASSYFPEVQGYSLDGTRTIFSAEGKLTSNASSENIRQIYESVNGVLKLVSVRPSGAANPGSATVGSTEGVGGGGTGRAANLTNAVSKDGSRIYWSEVDGSKRILVRVDGTKTIVVSSGAGVFWAATPSGDEAIYTQSGNLRRFDLATETSTTLVEKAAGGVIGVMGASKDLTRIYFASTDALAPGGVAEEPNLYLYEEGAPLTFIAQLSDGDLLREPAMSPVSLAPWRHAARVTPDGQSAVFMSRASLTGADNVDSASGEEVAEVFRYEATTEQLTCVSCSPAGARPSGERYAPFPTTVDYLFASLIPGSGMQLHAPRVISDDGSRVFFDTFNRLVLEDTNGARDVYQWEAPGKGTCTETNPRFSVEAAGCVSLISDGKNEKASRFVDASTSGQDVFFTTGASLVSQDPGQIDLYDARENGGFPAPVPPSECQGESCQQPVAPPPPPASHGSAIAGPGNPQVPRRCKKGFVRKKGKCVKKSKRHKKKHQRNAGKRSGR